MVALPVVRSSECTQKSFNNANKFIESIEDQETRSLVARVTANKKGESFYGWQSLFSQSTLQPQNKSEVGFRWLKSAKSPAELNAVKVAWEQEKWNLGEHGVSLANELLIRLQKENMKQEAKEVNAFLQMGTKSTTRFPASREKK